MYYTPEKSCYTCVHSVGTILEGYKNWSLFCTLKQEVVKEVCPKWQREVGSDDEIGRGD